jgi:hypothetical protein
MRKPPGFRGLVQELLGLLAGVGDPVLVVEERQPLSLGQTGKHTGKIGTNF